jgi:transposase
MYIRTKTNGDRTYLQVVESYWNKGCPRQKVIATLGRLDKLTSAGSIDSMIKSLSRFSKKVKVYEAYTSGGLETRGVMRIGPDLICQRLWKDLSIKRIIEELASDKNFAFSIERAIYLATLSRLFFPGSDRRASRLTRDYCVKGAEEINLHHLYRSMAWLGSKRERIEEALFARNRNLFSSLSMVFFDTTSLYFEGRGGENLGRRGYSKDRRPDENQMIVGAVLDGGGRPIACPMWPGNKTDAKTLIPIAASLKERFGVESLTLVADRGMVGAANIIKLSQAGFTYILGVKMRLEKKAMRKVLTHSGRYKEITDNLRVKEVLSNGKRYIVCLNLEEQSKDASDRQMILTSLEEKLTGGALTLIGNTGYRRYLKIDKGSVRIDEKKIKEEEAYDGKWVLTTNTDLPAEEVALKYKELWQVEMIFREVKHILKTRPIYHQNDSAILGHVFVSFLALVLMKELKSKLDSPLEWDEIRQDLDTLYEIEVTQDNKVFFLRSPLQGVASKVFKAVGVAIPPTVVEGKT